MKDRVNTNPHISHFVLARNRYFPNSALPVLIYRKAVDLPDQKNKAATIAQKLFLNHGWSNSWRNGIYDFHHYHSNTHEAMIICSGKANVILGGPNGRRVTLKQGDALILPAGVGHRCTAKSDDFLCVGAYPQGRDYDTLTGKAEELKEAAARISQLPVPRHDPVLGTSGFLKAYWKK